jgi:hypothetical protein
VNGEPTPRQRLRYAFDNLMARGTPALIGWLALVAAALTAVILIGNFAPKEKHHGIVGQAFAGLLHALDPGTIANDKGKWPFLLLMLLITIGGLFIVSALIGVLATGLDRRIEEMRKGRSMVLEEGHTLILGWSDTIFTVLAELEIANESQKRPVAVVLAERDKAEMDDLIREKVRPKRTRIVTRSGSPIDLGHLALVRAEKALWGAQTRIPADTTVPFELSDRIRDELLAPGTGCPSQSGLICAARRPPVIRRSHFGRGRAGPTSDRAATWYSWIRPPRRSPLPTVLIAGGDEGKAATFIRSGAARPNLR